jgi:2-keto-myo-inositol isomerase
VSASPAPSGNRRVFLNGATIMTTPTPRHLEIARETGYDGVELRAERLLESADEVRATAREVQPGEVWSLNGVLISLLPSGDLDRARLVADLESRLPICRDTGAAYLLAVPPRLPGATAESALPGIREGLEVARDAGARDGVRIAFEFLGFHDCPIRAPELAAAAVAGLEGVDLVLDSCHWHASGAAPLAAFPVDRLAMVHLNDAPAKEPARIEDADRVLPGDGVIALGSLVQELRERGYGGPWSLETFNPGYWDEDARSVARRGRDALRRTLRRDLAR